MMHLKNVLFPKLASWYLNPDFIIDLTVNMLICVQLGRGVAVLLCKNLFVTKKPQQQHLT